MPQVSVIIPNYNHESYLKKRIESVLNQTYKDFELIILDDCSTDTSVEIIESFRNYPEITQIVINKVNSGSTFYQWKKGLALAKGTYIWIAESDDLAMPHFLKQTVDFLEKHPLTSFVSTNANYINEWDEVLQNGYNHVCFKETKPKEHDGIDFFINHLAKGNAISNASAVLFKKEAVINDFDKILNYKLCGDWIFWSLMTKNGRVGILPDCLSSFRQHSKTVRDSMKMIHEKEEIIKAIDFLLADLQLPPNVKIDLYAHYYENYKLQGFESLFLKYAQNDPQLWKKKWKFYKYQMLKMLTKILK